MSMGTSVHRATLDTDAPAHTHPGDPAGAEAVFVPFEHRKFAAPSMTGYAAQYQPAEAA